MTSSTDAQPEIAVIGPGAIGATIAAEPSITRDREQGLPLEWEARNDVIRRYGAALGVPTPISDVVGPLLAAASDGW